jgi:polar amino acid transport system substrate-binding protein
MSSFKSRAIPQLLALAVLLVLSGCNSENESTSEAPPAAPAPPRHAAPAEGGNLARIQAAKVLRIGVKADNPPFGFQDAEGRPQGFDVDLGFRLARALQVQPVFVTVTSKDRIEKLKNGEIDIIIATLTATRSRSREIDFSMPYFQDQQGLLVPSASAIKSYRDLAGKRVAAAAGSTSIDNLKVVAPDCKAISVKSSIEGLEKLKAGDADAITGDGLSLQALRVDEADPNAFRLAGEGFSVEPYAIGLPRNDSELRVRVDEILTDLWTNGIWTRIFDKWLGPKTKYNFETHFQMPILPP